MRRIDQWYFFKYGVLEEVLMRLIYEETRIPVQIRRLMVFDEICRLAKSKPDEIVRLSFYAQKRAA